MTLLLESFGTLLRDPSHWEFEALVGFIEMVVFDVLIGVLVWPRIKAHIHRDDDDVAAHQQSLTEALAERVEDIRQQAGDREVV